MDWKKLKEDMTTPKGVREYIYDNAKSYQAFIKWLQWWHGKLIIRTFAFKCQRKGTNPILWTEVERAVVGEEYAIQKNIYYTQMGGYRAVFSDTKKISTNYYGYTYYYFAPEDFDVWHTEKAAGLYGEYINVDYIFTLKKYKYCGYSGKQDLKQYLEAYDKDHTVEYFGKAGLRYQVMLGKKAKKDKGFCKFIVENAEKVNAWGYQISEYAYTHKCSFQEAQFEVEMKRKADRFFRGCEKTQYKVDRVKIYKYAKLNIGKWNFERLYHDYWNACVVLGFDMRDTKNSMPNDFFRMHDIRTEEYASYKAEIDKEKTKEFNKRLEKAASKYMFDYQNKKYLVRLPQKKSDFVNEGEALHHCVGKMGYDGKMAAGKIIIAFIRLTEQPDKPFVTVEYDLNERRIMQMHGSYNSDPDKETRRFVNGWARKMREVQGWHEKAL